MRKSLLLAIGIVLASPLTAAATTYNIHMGGICSTQFSGGKGGGYLGSWAGEVSIDAPVDQRDSMATATANLASTLNTYCTGNNYCYIYTYSNGGAVVSRTLSLSQTTWNIGYVVVAAGNQGGSELGGTGWVGEVFGGCYLAGRIGPSDHRNGWNHHDTNGRIIGQIGGNGWLAPYAQSSILPGHDDGAVAEHSSGGYVYAGSYDSLCYAGKWTNHQTWWSCEYGSLNHNDLKMKHVCNDGGAKGCP
ncbi:MAG: hypothetical protein KF773_28085 [Deltaproteobacteria bacterium]|nr:hypothetical protein [Deltaproteobacteria bacterium]MCW5809324.1 hypothetical protein [Deltaproteobacteria bacterium]